MEGVNYEAVAEALELLRQRGKIRD